jgi:hypothetical protein
MTISPSFGQWPPGGLLLVPVLDDDDVNSNDSGAVAYFQRIDGIFRLVLPDGSTINVGPSAAPTPVIAPRAVVSIQSNLPDPPTVVYEQGSGIVLSVIQNALTFIYSVTCSVPISDATCAVIATAKNQGALQSLIVSFPGGDVIHFQGQQAVIDGGGGVSFEAVSLDFSFAIY